MPQPPRTPARDIVDVLHGIEVPDAYRWLENDVDPEVRAWVEAQNAYSRSVLEVLPRRADIEDRLWQVVNGGSVGVPIPYGRWLFYTRRSEGMDQPALYVREVEDDFPPTPTLPREGGGSSGDGPERALIDPGPLSRDGTTSLDWWTPSPDGELVCFGLSEGGNEISTLRLLRTATGEWLEDEIPRCRYASIAFEPACEAFLYTRFPEPGSVPPGEEMYHRHVWRHELGTDAASDVRVFGEGREKTDFPGPISISEDGRWTVIELQQGWDRTCVFLRDGDGAFEPIFENFPNVLHAWFAGDRLLGLTNLGAPRYRLVEIDPEQPAPEAWRDLIPEQEHVLTAVAVTEDRIAAHHLIDACSRVSLHHLDGTLDRPVELPPYSSVMGFGCHHRSPDLYLAVQTFTAPTVVFRTGAAGRSIEVERLAPPAGFDPARYPVRQVWFSSRDGTRVPMFLVGRNEGAGPTLLTGYGGFNISMTPGWNPRLLPLLEAGGLFALPNLRGGGEFGEPWHQAGMLGLKQNVFDDFIAAAEYLIEQGLTTSAQLGIDGGSNGGLLVGAAMTQRPELFGCVVCRVPLLDMVRYERFRIAQLWSREYGSASDPEQFRWLLAYSPYHHVREDVSYPPTLLTTGEEDSRVDPMHARKMAARLQAVAAGGPVLLRVETRAGHGAGKPVSKAVVEEADVLAFLLAHLTAAGQ